MDPLPHSAAVESFEAQYRQVAPALFVWVGLRLGTGLRVELDPEDVLQEVACRAFARLETYDASRGSFRNWIFGIARNVLLQAMEQLTGRGKPDREWLTTGGLAHVPAETTSITRRVATNDTIATFLEYVDTLPEEDRELVLHRGLEGKSHEQVAQTLGLEPSAAAKRWERLQGRLRDRTSGLDLLT